MSKKKQMRTVLVVDTKMLKKCVDLLKSESDSKREPGDDQKTQCPEAVWAPRPRGGPKAPPRYPRTPPGMDFHRFWTYF